MTSEIQNPSDSTARPSDTDENISFAEMLAQQEEDSSQNRIEPGQKVTVTIVAITADTIFVSTGSKVDGLVERAEMEVDGELSCKVGDTLELYVITATPHEVKLSRVMSGDASLASLEEAQKSGLPVEGRVTGQVKGGYSVDIMKRRAFCPGSQIDIRPLADPESVVGQTYAFRITKVESRGRNIVVSRRDLLEMERAETLEKLLGEMHEGDIREGTVSRLAPFGAFIELAPGVEGLAHISELSWSRVDTPEAAVQVGDKVQVKVLGIAREPKGLKISLSIKAAMPDPWNSALKELTPGSIVTGKVVRLMQFGAFVEVLPGVEGLIHLSELSFERRIMKADEVVSVGDMVTVTIKEIDPERHRISLSLRDAAGNPWDSVHDTLKAGTDVPGTVEKRAPFGLFINLAPGLTGLLPNQVITASPQRKALDALKPGDTVTVRIRDIDADNRRISLLPEGEEESASSSHGGRNAHGASDAGEKNWKQHMPKADNASSFGALGLALQAAKAKKEGK